MLTIDDLPELELVEPEALQQSNLTLSAAGYNLADGFLRALAGEDASASLRRLNELRAAYRQHLENPPRQRLQPAYKPLQVEHEQYFRLHRVEGRVADILLDNIVDTYFRFIADAGDGSNLVTQEKAAIHRSLTALAGYIRRASDSKGHGDEA